MISDVAEHISFVKTLQHGECSCECVVFNFNHVGLLYSRFRPRLINEQYISLQIMVYAHKNYILTKMNRYEQICLLCIMCVCVWLRVCILQSHQVGVMIVHDLSESLLVLKLCSLSLPTQLF